MIPRTKHIVILVVAVIASLIVFEVLITLMNVRGGNQVSVIDTEGLFVEAIPSLSVESKVAENKSSIREAFLAKLSHIQSTASVVTAEETTPEVEETETHSPSDVAEVGFDWSVWVARVPEFTEKKTTYELLLNDFKNQVAKAQVEKAILLTSTTSASASGTPETNTGEGVVCLNVQITKDQEIVTNLESTSVGLLYKTLIDEITLQSNGDQVAKLYEQIVAVELKNNAIVSAYAQSAVNCEQYYSEEETVDSPV